MKNYRLATTEDYDACVQLLTDAFQDYDFHKIYCTKTEELRRAFNESIFEVAIRLGIKKGQVMVMEEDGVILSVAQLQSPADSDFSVLEYLKNGIFKTIRIGGLKNILGYIKLLESSEAECKRIKEPHWYLMAFGVLPSYQNKGLGTQMLQEGVLPYIKNQGGGLVAFVTNSASNEKFYNSNGFNTLKYELLNLNGKELGNWTLTKRVSGW